MVFGWPGHRRVHANRTHGHNHEVDTARIHTHEAERGCAAVVSHIHSTSWVPRPRMMELPGSEPHNYLHLRLHVYAVRTYVHTAVRHARLCPHLSSAPSRVVRWRNCVQAVQWRPSVWSGFNKSAARVRDRPRRRANLCAARRRIAFDRVPRQRAHAAPAISALELNTRHASCSGSGCRDMATTLLNQSRPLRLARL